MEAALLGAVFKLKFGKNVCHEVKKTGKEKCEFAGTQDSDFYKRTLGDPEPTSVNLCLPPQSFIKEK